MPHKVFFNNEGYIEIVLEGAQTVATTYGMIRDSLKFNDVMSAQKGVIKVLMDATGITTLDSGAADKATSANAAISLDKLAIFGARQGEIKQKITAIVAASGETERTRLFDTRQDAVAWLKK